MPVAVLTAVGGLFPFVEAWVRDGTDRRRWLRPLWDGLCFPGLRRKAFEALQQCYAGVGKVTRAQEGAADARFHLAIAEASHNAVLLHTIRALFDLLKRNVLTNIGGMYAQRSETREMLMQQHGELYAAIIDGQAELARQISNRHIDYVQEVLAEVGQEAQRTARAQRRQGL